MKKLLRKYEDLNEADFNEFLQYFSNQFNRITDDSNENTHAFFAACAKVCSLKHVLVKNEDYDEKKPGKTQPHKLITKVILKRPILRDLLYDVDGYVSSLMPLSSSNTNQAFPQNIKDF